ncbi:MAG: hypothetical protein IKF66_01165 [Methanobrevibacter sp.]|nr:hypothetical protein [Methanobrevibacter sp.]
MNAEVMEAKVTTMECDIKEIKNDIKNMPKEVAKEMESTMDMKIQLAVADMKNNISEVEKKYQLKIIALLIGMIGEGIGIIISLVKVFLK